MNNPQIYTDGLANSIQDSPLRVQNKILGALKNMGGASTSAATQSVVNVTTSAVSILAANASRKFMTLQNIGVQEVYIKFGSAPVATGSKSFAFVLKPASVADGGDGGVLSLQSYTGSVYAITASGSAEVAVTQFT